MASVQARATVYLDPALHRALRLKAAATHPSISDTVADAVRESLREDEEDLSAVAQRVNEPSLAYEAFLAQLKADGTL